MQAVVVAYGDRQALDDCLRTLAMRERAAVVDNGGDAEPVARRHGARYIRSPRNVGYAAAVNVGLREAVGQDVLLVNPDAQIPPAAVDALHVALRSDETTAAVAPVIPTEPSWWPVPHPLGTWAEAVGLRDRRRRFLGGAVLLLRAEAIEDVGLFDERFFLYAEEADWQVRAMSKGWQVRVVDGATARHVGAGASSDSARRQRLFTAGAETFVRKWYGARGWQLYRAGAVLSAVRRLVVGRGPVADRLRLLGLLVRGPARAAAADIAALRR